ncbi:Origin recognition complex subunit 2 [Coemansia interrupta]|uniref:Origin recognition complex subunit 2 n=1 Tax=Coemansia interrupta TaxID=1126814 RepID=A0A9W8HCJ4_9FUNG|nr:Origin recognition complex subunit 2 [Coemansia interrupta]
MSGDAENHTPRRAVYTSSRVDMGLTLTATKRGRKTLLIDNSHNTPTRAGADIAEILKLSAAVDAEDKENSSEEAVSRLNLAGQSVYGFQKSVTRGRGRGRKASGSSSTRGSVVNKAARGRGRGRGRRGAGVSSSASGSRRKTMSSVPDGSRGDEYDEDEEEEDEEEDDDGRGVDNDAANDSQDDGENESLADGMLDLGEDAYGNNGPAYERYFQDLHTTRGSKTSDNTLSKLPPLSQAECRSILAKVPTKHKNELELLESLHRKQFSQWFFELACGFNLVFYGYGSKRRMINSLATRLSTKSPTVIVNGYFPTLNFKQTLERILSEVVGFGDTTGSVADLASLIHGYFESDTREVDNMYIVVHNIDGPCLRKHQAALAVLASSKNISLLASIDHIEAPLIWDSSMITRFNWAWHDLTTFDPYTVETSYENYGTESTEIGPRGVLHVLASLTENAKNVFRILAEYQIAESIMDDDAAGAQKKTGSKVPEMPYNGYFAACRDQFLVSSELTFRSQLTEFRDHKVIQSRHATDGTEFVHIPLDATTLGTILESMD